MRPFFNTQKLRDYNGKSREVNMAEFKIIETQEQLDAILSERLGRAKDSVRKEFDGWISPEDLDKRTADLNAELSGLNDQIKTLTEAKATLELQLTEKDGKIAEYETNSVKLEAARKYGLSYDAIKFLQGDDKEAIEKSAESLKNLVGAQKAQPLGNPEAPPEEDGVIAAFKKLNPNINI